jgi:hypothetical protein
MLSNKELGKQLLDAIIDHTKEPIYFSKEEIEKASEEWYEKNGPPYANLRLEPWCTNYCHFKE